MHVHENCKLIFMTHSINCHDTIKLTWSVHRGTQRLDY